jgi:hypothetical protein
MYHGEVVPGFPQHPHRGFETVTIVRHGRVDHSDSLGAAARFGSGDVQWLTAGAGIVHSEMFPLLQRNEGNRLELFQIWLNLPSESKFTKPYFSMLWADQVPTVVQRGDTGGATHVTVVAGSLAGAQPPSPPPDSWASRADSEVAIWTIRMEPEAVWSLPRASGNIARTLYLFQGGPVEVAGEHIAGREGLLLRPDVDVSLKNAEQETELLLLQGRPIDEPVAHYGPFVMNTREELQQAMVDYQRTRFGGWPWQSDGPVHERDRGRFARHEDGRVETRD